MSTPLRAWALAAAGTVLLSGCLKDVRPATRVALTFAKGSEVVTRELGLAELESYGLVPAATTWPFGKAKYEGVLAWHLLDAAGGLTSETNYVVFHCADGYAAYIPAGFLKRYPAVLVTRVNGKPPELWKLHKGKPVGLYLALPNAAYPELDGARYNVFWAMEIVGLETARLHNRLAPASQSLKAGQDLFVQQCIHCHTTAGAGGLKGPDLTNVKANHDAVSFANYVKKPADLNPKTEMPAYGDMLSVSEITSLYNYLGSLSK